MIDRFRCCHNHQTRNLGQHGKIASLSTVCTTAHRNRVRSRFRFLQSLSNLSTCLLRTHALCNLCQCYTNRLLHRAAQGCGILVPRHLNMFHPCHCSGHHQCSELSEECLHTWKLCCRNSQSCTSDAQCMCSLFHTWPNKIHHSQRRPHQSL